MVIVIAVVCVLVESCIFGDYRGLVYIDERTKVTCRDGGSRFPFKCYEESHSQTCCKTCVDIRRTDKPGTRPDK